MSGFMGGMLRETENCTVETYFGGHLAACQYVGGPLTDISNRLREERKRLGLSQTELGAVGGVSKDAQLNYENGSRSPAASYLAAVAAIGLDVQYVLTGVRAIQTPLSAEEQALLDNYKHSDEEGRAAARRVLSSLAQSKKAA